MTAAVLAGVAQADGLRCRTPAEKAAPKAAPAGALPQVADHLYIGGITAAFGGQPPTGGAPIR